jgi:hypothetical protein
MKALVLVASVVAAISFAPAAITSADAQTVVIKHRHGHGHVHHPRKKVVVIQHGRRHGHWHGRGHWRGHAHGHRPHRHGATVGVTVR